MTLQAAAGEAATEPVSTVVVVVIGLYLALSLFVGMRAGGKTTDSAAGYVAGALAQHILTHQHMAHIPVFPRSILFGIERVNIDEILLT